ncbi:MAG TPA: winged helix-turn-helix transcriptional regulator [Vicinamibacterales bacterium]|nr:winged helix-turn-helix transcriptional regulator [Vicinamibacterales bacterium]
MRSYHQYCGLARALDVVGDRWTLLIVRELLIGECRYTDLLNGLPGIASNLLATRLAELEDAGLVEKAALPPPAAATVFRLTPRGQALRPVIRALGQWAAPLMTGRSKADAVRTRWMVLPAQFYLEDQLPGDEPIAIQIDGGDESMVIESRNGTIVARPGTVADPDLRLVGSPELALGIMMGRLSPAEARRRGLTIEGDPRLLKRLRRAS